MEFFYEVLKNAAGATTSGQRNNEVNFFKTELPDL